MSENTEPKDGGPAYIFKCHDMKVYYGKSLRDDFAGLALAGLLACPVTKGENYLMFAKEAYAFADAMLKAREQKE